MLFMACTEMSNIRCVAYFFSSTQIQRVRGHNIINLKKMWRFVPVQIRPVIVINATPSRPQGNALRLAINYNLLWRARGDRCVLDSIFINTIFIAERVINGGINNETQKQFILIQLGYLLFKFSVVAKTLFYYQIRIFTIKQKEYRKSVKNKNNDNSNE